jgi:Helix-turn-helix domain
MTPGEVAAVFRVTPRTVSNWAAAGLLPCITTLGGHRRYCAAAVTALVAQHLPRGQGAAATFEPPPASADAVRWPTTYSSDPTASEASVIPPTHQNQAP